VERIQSLIDLFEVEREKKAKAEEELEGLKEEAEKLVPLLQHAFTMDDAIMRQRQTRRLLKILTADALLDLILRSIVFKSYKKDSFLKPTKVCLFFFFLGLIKKGFKC
jgi:hypothetical protein